MDLTCRRARRAMEITTQVRFEGQEGLGKACQKEGQPQKSSQSEKTPAQFRAQEVPPAYLKWGL